MIRTFDLEEFKHLTHHVEDVRAGRYVIMVLTKRRDQRIVAGDILHHYGAEFVGFYGRWAWADLPAKRTHDAGRRPGAVRAGVERRDSDALASLFDEDAEFVNGTGLWWHDRESIRQGAHGPAGTRSPTPRSWLAGEHEGQAAVTRGRGGSRAT